VRRVGWGELNYQQVKENEYCDTIEIKAQLLQQRVRGTGFKLAQLTNDAAVARGGVKDTLHWRLKENS